jgi:hypothetical protein
VTLLDDVDLAGSHIEINKKVTIDLAGKTISSNDIELFQVESN